MPFEAFASDNQNAKEFLGLLLAIVLLKTIFNAPRGTTIALTNDNMSALSWIHDNKASSSRAHIAFVAYSWVIIITGFHIIATDHIAGSSERMYDIDALSRDYRTRTLDDAAFIVTTGNEHLDTVFKLCDPTKDRNDLPKQMEEFQLVIAAVAAALSN